MLELFGWDIGMGAWASILLVLGALMIGGVLHLIGRVNLGYEWLIAAVGALVGGWLGSESLAGASTWGPAFDGMYLLPALIGAVVIAGAVDLLVRTMSGGTYRTHEPRPI